MRRRISRCSINSDNSEPDVDVIAQTELTKLQREFRIMVASKQAYATESEDIIRRQRREIQILQDEHDDLLCSLRVTEGKAGQDTEDIKGIRHMLVLQDSVETQINQERHIQKSLKQEILELEREIADARKDKQPVIKRSKNSVLENKLDQGTVRCNKILSKNRKLREEITILHIERQQFQLLYSKLENELEHIRRDIKDVMNKTTAASDGRLDMQLKTMFLKEKMMKDQVQHDTELGELERVISHNDNLKHFMSIKNQERSGQGDNQDHPRKQEKEEKKESGTDLEMSFKKIQEVLGEEDVDKIMAKFTEVDDWNFSSLNYVNEQNNEAEHIRHQISQIMEEIESMKASWQRQQAEHATAVQTLSCQQQQIEKDRLAYEQRITALNKILDQLKTGIYAILDQVKCDRSTIDEQLGTSCDNRESIIMAFLGLVESRTNELLTIQSFLNAKDLDKEYSAAKTACHLLGQSPPLSSQELIVRPPVRWDDSDTEDDESALRQKTLSREELYEHAMKRVQQRKVRPEVKTSRVSLGPGFRQRTLAMP